MDGLVKEWKDIAVYEWVCWIRYLVWTVTDKAQRNMVLGRQDQARHF